MLHLRRGAVGLLMAGVLLAACGGDDDNGGGGGGGTTLTPTESAALVGALAKTGLVDAGDQATPFLIGGIKSYGTITVPAPALRAPQGVKLASLSAGDFAAVGVQYGVDVTVNGEPIQGAAAYVLGWKGLNVQAQTVDEVLQFGGFVDGATTFPDPISGNVPDDVEAFYWTATDNGTLFLGTSGTASLGSANFGGSSTNCSQEIPNVGTITCSYRYGRMEGTFGFEATEFNGQGGITTFPSTTYDVPAVRVSLSGNINVAVGVQAEAVKASLRKLLKQQ